MKNLNYKNKAFTLVEIMIVLVILGLLISVALPKVSQVLTQGKVNATNATLSSLSKAMKSFNADVGVWPSTIADLMSPITTSGRGYHSKTLAEVNYSSVHIKNWKGPYMEGTTVEVSVDAWNSKISIGVVGSAPNYTFLGKDIDGNVVTFNAKDCNTFINLGSVPGLYLHSCGDDTLTGTNPETVKDDIMVFVTGKL